MTTFRTPRAALVAVTLVLAASACASSPANPPSSSSGLSPEPSSPPAAPARVLPGWDPSTTESITVESADFEAGEEFPRSIELNGYGCHGENVRPEIHWGDLPEGTKSVVVTFTAEGGGPLNRWTLIDVPPDVRSVPGGTEVPEVGTIARNGMNQSAMLGPCAKPGESWELWFTVYAMDTVLGLPQASAQSDVLGAGMGHVLAAGELAGFHSYQED